MLEIRRRKYFNQGQSLWEVVVALAIACLVALGLVRLSTISVSGSRFSGDQSKITALAQKKISEIISYKNNPATANDFWYGTYDPGEDYNATEGYCLHSTLSDASALLPATTPNYATARMMQINVKVYWDEKTGSGTSCSDRYFSHSSSFDTYVTN